MKLVGTAASNGAGIGGYCTKPQAQTVEYAGIGAVHDTICLIQAINVGMEGIRIFHHKFACPHYTKAGPDLVAKFGLDLIKGHRQLAVTLDFASNNVGNHFLMRGTKAEIALMPVLDFQHLRTKHVPAARFPP